MFRRSVRTAFRLNNFLNERRYCYTVCTPKKSTQLENHIANQLRAKIKATGPITVADYMKEVLTNPSGGYYMHQEIFGPSGDFITSPELSQMFGEMVAVWLLNEWSKIGSPKPFQIVELGPGKGTLSQDILRVFEHFGAVKGANLNLVEVSPNLTDVQFRRLCVEDISPESSEIYRKGVSHQGVQVTWYRHLDDLPEMFTLLVAHEFFDALPVHKFQLNEQGQYREVLVDLVNPDDDKDFKFRYVIARNDTPASKLLIGGKETRKHFEMSPQSLVIVGKIAERLESHGGFALIADYGHKGEKTDTFRAFKKHKLHDPLVDPGTADLTADVDFNSLKRVVGEKGGVMALGPVTQRNFLLKMGIEQRFKSLQTSASDEDREGLEFSYHTMIDEDKMGDRFKFLCLAPRVLEEFLKKYPVVGFN